MYHDVINYIPSLADLDISPYGRPARDILTRLLLGYRLELCLIALSEMEKELCSPFVILMVSNGNTQP